MGLIIEHSYSLYLILVVIMGGGAAFMAGRALASGWKPIGQLLAYMIPFTAAVRFLQYALFNDEKLGTPNLTSGHYFITDFILLAAIALFGYQLTRTNQMVRQYPWLYEKSGPLGWKAKT
jgi:hypothetical protein